MAELLAVDELGTYLLAQRVVQDRNTAVSATVPSLWINPRQEAPEPRDGEGATVTLADTGLGGASPMEPFLEEAFIDVIVRAGNVGTAQMIHRTIRGLLTPREAIGGRKNWQMGGLLVEQSLLWRREQDLPTTNAGRTYDRVQSFLLLYRVRSLTTP